MVRCMPSSAFVTVFDTVVVFFTVFAFDPVTVVVSNGAIVSSCSGTKPGYTQQVVKPSVRKIVSGLVHAHGRPAE